MCVCMCVCVCVCSLVGIIFVTRVCQDLAFPLQHSTHTHTYYYTHMYGHSRRRTHWTHTHILTITHTCAHTYRHIRWIHTQIHAEHTHIRWNHMNTHAHTHTHTHTHTRWTYIHIHTYAEHTHAQPRACTHRVHVTPCKAIHPASIRTWPCYAVEIWKQAAMSRLRYWCVYVCAYGYVTWSTL